MEKLLTPRNIKGLLDIIAKLPPQAKAFIIAAGGILVIGKGIQVIGKIAEDYFKANAV